MVKMNDVILTDSIDGIGTEQFKDYLAHAICTRGAATLCFNGKQFEFREGDLMIVRKGSLLYDIDVSEDFMVQNLYITAPFVTVCTPQNNYGTKGSLALFLNPIMHLTDKQRFVCEPGFRMDQIPPGTD